MLSLQEQAMGNADVMNSQVIEIANPSKLDYLTLTNGLKWQLRYIYIYDVTYNFISGQISRTDYGPQKKYNSDTGDLVRQPILHSKH